MPDSSKKFIVAVFVIAAIVVMGGLVMAFGGGRRLLTDTYELNVVFKGGVQGVQQGQTVTLNGKRIGETTDLRFINDDALQDGVIVVVAVDDYDLPSGCEMVVSPNIMGIGKPPVVIRVVDPSVREPLPRDGTAEIPGRVLPMLDQLLPPETQSFFKEATFNIGELASALKPVADNLNRLLEARSIQDVDAQSVTANLDTLVQRFDKVLQSIEIVMGNRTNQENIAALMANARTMSETGVTTMENIRDMTEEGKTVARDLDQLLKNLTAAGDQLSAVLARMDETMIALNSKSGTAGLLLNDNRLYEEMVLSARRLTKMLDDMREVLDLAKKGQLRIKAF
jgi:phospholipid/cholesterol/gamma-HCH transport system substrate-binding protein